MIVLLSHPQNGNMHVYSEAEAVEHEKHGWVRQAEPPVGSPPEAPPVDADLAARYEAKYGKPPHHLMKLETMRARLEE